MVVGRAGNRPSLLLLLSFRFRFCQMLFPNPDGPLDPPNYSFPDPSAVQSRVPHSHQQLQYCCCCCCWEQLQNSWQRFACVAWFGPFARPPPLPVISASFELFVSPLPCPLHLTASCTLFWGPPKLQRRLFAVPIVFRGLNAHGLIESGSKHAKWDSSFRRMRRFPSRIRVAIEK